MNPPILAAYCPQDDDRGPVAFAATVARAAGVPLIVTAIHSPTVVVDVYSGAELADLPRELAERALEEVRTDLGELPAGLEMRAVEGSTPASGIVSVVEDVEPALVVLGSTRRGPIGRVLPGSTAERVVHGAGCPVVVVPVGYAAKPAGVETVGAAFIPTPDGREALRAGAAIARAVGARLRAVAVLNPHLADHQADGMLALHHHEGVGSEEEGGRLRSSAEQALHDAIAELGDAVEVEPDVLFQEAADGLVAASAQLDLLVMGSRAYGPLRAVMLGGVSRHVIARAACPVLVLPRGTHGPPDSLLQAVAAPGASA